MLKLYYSMLKLLICKYVKTILKPCIVISLLTNGWWCNTYIGDKHIIHKIIETKDYKLV